MKMKNFSLAVVLFSLLAAGLLIPVELVAKSVDFLSAVPSCLFSFPTDARARKAAVRIKEKTGLQGRVWVQLSEPKNYGRLTVTDVSSSQGQSLADRVAPHAEAFGGKLLSCDSPEKETPEIVDKPVIYLYPQRPQKVFVKLDYQGTLVADYPDYDPEIGGWEVTAFPDGRLRNEADGHEYSYLFWEGIPREETAYDLSRGFVVPGPETKSFLQKTLREMGLAPKEYNEFIVYWLPRMQGNPYNLIHFAGREYEGTAPLTIVPEPDSILRVFMVFQRLEEKRPVLTQELKPFQREGFAVVEWGGTEIRR